MHVSHAHGDADGVVVDVGPYLRNPRTQVHASRLLADTCSSLMSEVNIPVPIILGGSGTPANTPNSPQSGSDPLIPLAAKLEEHLRDAAAVRSPLSILRTDLPTGVRTELLVLAGRFGHIFELTLVRPGRAVLTGFEYAESSVCHSGHAVPRDWHTHALLSWAAVAGVFAKYIGIQNFPGGTQGFGVGPVEWMSSLDDIRYRSDGSVHSGVHYEFVRLDSPRTWGCASLGDGWWLFSARPRQRVIASGHERG